METHSTRLALAGLLLATACSKTEVGPIVTLEGARYEWAFFNHRVSHIEFGVDEKKAWTAIVGGTSTSSLVADLPAECEPDTCQELTFADEADVRVDWARVDEPDAASAVATVRMTADADGEDELVTVELKKAEDLPVSAMIRAIRLSTNHPLDGGDACYNPAFGWLPTHMGVALGEPVAKGDEVTVEVSAVFEGGKTLEAIRGCLDEVYDRARLAVEVDVLVIAGGEGAASADVSSAATWELGDGGSTNPDPQTPPAPESVALGLSDPVVGWQRLEWRFHIDDPDTRGGYLRSLDFQADAGEAQGTATNYSKVTQLSGFDYTFEGTVVGHDVGGRVTRGSLETRIPVEVDPETFEPAIQELGSTK